MVRTLNIIIFVFLLSWGFTLSSYGQASAGVDESRGSSKTIKITKHNTQNNLTLAQGGMHHGMGPGMGRGCDGAGMGHGPDGMGCGRHGRGHHGGMGPGMGQGEEGIGSLCPQPRSTEKAPELLYSMSNPLENSLDNIERGRLLFQLDAQPTCTACHGTNGDGLGMMGGALTPPPRNFTCAETMQSIPDGQLFWIIQNGSSGTGMPSFINLVDEEIWQLILFLRTFAN